MSKQKLHLASTYSTANLSDKKLKEEGNRLFSLRRYEDAMNYYTKAIIKNPSVATYYTKRALCHLKVERWEATCQDCRRALDIVYDQIKGHLFLGQALVELEFYDEAVKHLHRADDLAREQKLNFGDEIAAQLRIARKKRWDVQEEKSIIQEIELQTYLNRLISEDMQRRKRKAAKGKTANIEEECNKYTSELNNLCAKIDNRRRKRDVPDYLCGKISFEILRDPVITPSGITYERKDIEEHLERVGYFDPQTRVELTADQLIPNLSMREVVDSFLQENEWALDD
ncbi:E3 ubiquitin-protein ligase CHIP-like [Cydia fagiglandana]|uniref:E3 ubiquitin-protein ligase CHIP-like n=1 Tax=Cydia fagiglandana TaxID=1458189 RepID=UPI002FEE4F77